LDVAKIVWIFRLMRPKQWVKNIFVLAPLIFASAFTDILAIRDSLLAAFFFCIASSAVYVLNDIKDVERDRRHPRKSITRPLAVGAISVQGAIRLIFVLCCILMLGWLYSPAATAVIIIYLVLNFSYSFWLKHVPVLDIFTIAFGFVLRVYAGAQALVVPVSAWMFVTTLCLALYLASIKRRQELKYQGDMGRDVLQRYTVALVDRYAEMAATGALVFYSMFVMSAQHDLVVTVPIVLFGLFRYWFIVEQLDGGESPTDALLSDMPLIATVISWVGVCLWVLWPTASV